MVEGIVRDGGGYLGKGEEDGRRWVGQSECGGCRLEMGEVVGGVHRLCLGN